MLEELQEHVESIDFANGKITDELIAVLSDLHGYFVVIHMEKR